MARNLIYINFTNGKCIDIISDIGSAAHTPVWPNNGTILSISNNNTTKLSLIPITKKNTLRTIWIFLLEIIEEMVKLLDDIK